MILALVANPRSGGETDPDTLTELLAQDGAQVVLIPLSEIDAPLPPGTDRVVLAGGDGSIGVAARAAHHAGLPLAVIPAGTANDFARAAGLPDDVSEACRLAADPAAGTRRHEVGDVDGHPFVNAAAAGLSAVASRHASGYKSRLGPAAYLLGALKAGVTADPVTCRVRCDGEQRFSGRAWQVIVGVTGAFGGGSAIGGTRRDDGELDVAVVSAGSRLALVARAYGMRRGELTAQDGVHHLRGAVVEIELSGRGLFNVDGDVRECRPGRFSLLPGGVAVVVP